MAKYTFSFVDGRKLRTFISAIEKAISEADKVPEILKKYDRLFAEEAELAVKHVVDAFYESYTPFKYGRKLDLYHTYELIITDSIWDWKFGPEYMEAKHHQDNSYIYQNSFIEGYHGGVDYGKGHPDPGTPWWRGLPSFKYWSRPATQWGESPYYMALIELDKVVDTLVEQKVNECVSILNNNRTRCKDAFWAMIKV